MAEYNVTDKDIPIGEIVEHEGRLLEVVSTEEYAKKYGGFFNCFDCAMVGEGICHTISCAMLENTDNIGRHFILKEDTIENHYKKVISDIKKKEIIYRGLSTEDLDTLISILVEDCDIMGYYDGTKPENEGFNKLILNTKKAYNEIKEENQ